MIGSVWLGLVGGGWLDPAGVNSCCIQWCGSLLLKWRLPAHLPDCLPPPPHPPPLPRPPLPCLQQLCYCGEKLKGRYTIAKHFHGLMARVTALGEIVLQVDSVDHQPLQGAVRRLAGRRTAKVLCAVCIVA